MLFRRPFDFNGRQFLNDSDGMNMPTPIATNRTPGFGIIASFRPTANRTRSFGYSTPGGSVGMMYGRDSTTGAFQMLHSSSELVLSTVPIALNSINIVFAWTYSASSHILAANSIQTLETNTSTMQLDSTTHLHIGDAGLASGSSGALRGDMYWIGALALLPPLGLVDAVLQRRAPPTILRSYLANLVPFVGNGTEERCLINGATMVFRAGTPPVATRQGWRPQGRPPIRLEALGSVLARRYTLTVSHGGDSETSVSITAEAGTYPDAVLIEIPTGTEREAGISVNGSEFATTTLPADPNAQSGDLFLGARISSGAATSDAVQADFMGWLAANTGDLGARDRLLSSGRSYLAPFISNPSLSATVASDGSIDLATVIKDPAGAGYTIALGSLPAGLTADLASTTLTYRAEAEGTYLLPVTLTSAHPIIPVNSFDISIEITDTETGVLFANGYKYRRKLTRVAQPTLAAGNLLNFPIPVRITAQTWAKSVANGGKLEATSEVDLMVGDSAGNPLPFEIRPNSTDLTAGTHILVYGQDTNPAVAQTAYLYYGKRLTESPEDPEALYGVDYLDVYTGGDNDRNPAALSRPWNISEVVDEDGLLGLAGDFASTTAEVTQPSSTHLSGLDQFSTLICIKRTSSAGNDKGYIAIGDLTSEGTSSFTMRDATSATGTTNTIKIAFSSTAGRPQFRGASNLLTTDWQVLSCNWDSGGQVHLYINGERAADGQVFASVAGTTSFTGPLVIGLAGGAASFGRFGGLIDEVRIGRKARGINWARLEYLSLTDAGFVTIGAEEVPGDVTATLVAGNDTFNFANNEAASYLLDVLANDVRDPPGVALSISDYNITSGGGSMVVEDNKLRFTPSSTTFAGDVTGSYTVTDGTLSDTATFTVTIDEPAVISDDLFFNPFNKWSAHHRPIGADVEFGIPPSVEPGNVGTSTASHYNAGVKLNATESNADEARGRLSGTINMDLENSIVGSKYLWKLTATNKETLTFDRRDGTGTFSVTIPKLGATAYYPIRNADDAAKERDYQVLVYPKNAGTADLLVSMRDTDYFTPGANTPREWPIGGIDCREHSALESWTGASRIRWPMGFIRGFEVNPTNPGPINHALQASCDRLSSNASAHIMGRRCVWPSYGTDSFTETATSGPRNRGNIPYGTCVTLRDADYTRIRAALVTANNKRGVRIVDAIYFYGIYLIDGNGSANSIQLRCDAEVGWEPSATGKVPATRPGAITTTGRVEIPNVVSDINAALRACQSYLWPIYNSQRYGTTNAIRQVHTDGLPYVGGGGPRDGKTLALTGSKNTAHDA